MEMAGGRIGSLLDLDWLGRQPESGSESLRCCQPRRPPPILEHSDLRRTAGSHRDQKACNRRFPWQKGWWKAPRDPASGIPPPPETDDWARAPPRSAAWER